MGLGVVYAQNYPGPFEAAKFRIPPGTTTARAKVAAKAAGPVPLEDVGFLAQM